MLLNPLTGKTIFIQIASFRDSQLLPTIHDMIDRADEPTNLRVCICHQHHEDDEWDTLDEYKGDDRFTIIDVDAKDSKGVCWARNLIQQEYKGEDFTLQLDSHHRFIDGWDTELKNQILQLQLLGHSKPLLTSYISSFHPDKDRSDWTKEPWQMQFDRFTPEGIVFFKPCRIPNWENLNTPIPGRFYSAHFCFTLGIFCEEVPHDPRFYFHGEEIAIAVRAFTHGYDIFTPHKVIAWHEYSRNYRPDKHWDAYDDVANHNLNTYNLVKGLLGIDGVSKSYSKEFGLGSVRSITEWENYAGIRFKDRSVQKATIKGELPPNDTSTPFCKIFKHCINIQTRLVEDVDFIAVILKDENDNELFRKDFMSEELIKACNGDWTNLWIEAEVSSKPYKWIAWPYKDSLWLDLISGKI